MYLWFFINII